MDTKAKIRRIFLAGATAFGVLCVLMLAAADYLERRHDLNEGDMVMFVAPGIDGRQEWKGPFPVAGYTEDDRIAIDADGTSVVIDQSQAIPLDLYRNRKQ